MNTPSQPPVPTMIWWVLWFALQSGLFVVYFILGAKAGSGTAEPNSALLAVPAMQLLASGALRWVVLPKMCEARKALPVFIVGMAMAEGACFSGLFLVPAYKQELFIASLLGVGQFLPLFAAKFNAPPRQ